jgi:hypothetical protein
VQGPVPGLYAAAPTATFTFYNTSGASVTITNYGFSDSTEGDAVTQPAGIYTNSDFTVVPTGGSFPVTVANNASHSFTVTYAPLRRGSGFGDVRSAILVLYAGSVALSNGGQTTNSSGEVINLGLPKVLTIGVGGGVIEEGYDWATVAPILQSSGNASQYAIPAGYGDSAPANSVGGMSTNMTLADIDTKEHYAAMLFWTAFQTGVQTSTVRAPAAGAPSYVDVAGSGGNTSTTLVPSTSYDYGSPRGGRGYQIYFWASDATLTLTLAIQADTSAGWVTVQTWNNVSSVNSGNLFIGNVAGLDLQGLELRAVTSNLATNGGAYNTTTSYNVGAVITG